MLHASDNSDVRLTRCPRCRAMDIAADAHPTRVLNDRVEARVFVCRNCYRPSELEYRMACDAAGVPHRPLPIRDGLRDLHDFYAAQLADVNDPKHLVEDDERAARARLIQASLDDVDRRLAIGPVAWADT